MKENPPRTNPPATGKSSPRQSLGRWGEDQAANYLTSRGYHIIERNLRTPHGELDLVAQLQAAPVQPEQADLYPNDDRPTIVFIEVKTRSTHTFGYPEVSVSARKRTHLLNAAQFYMQQHSEMECHWRIDVIAIQRAGLDQPAQIVHFENALGV